MKNYRQIPLSIWPLRIVLFSILFICCISCTPGIQNALEKTKLSQLTPSHSKIITGNNKSPTFSSSLTHTPTKDENIYKEGWKTNGPWGGLVGEIIISPKNPNVVYAVAPYGIFISSNSGNNWIAVGNGLPHDLRTVVIDQNNPSIIYAVMLLEGIYKSMDGGSSWNGINSGLPGDGRGCTIAIDPKDSSTLYAGTFRGVFKSTDGGSTWINQSNGLPEDNSVDNIFINPILFDNLYVVIRHVLYISSDGGESWHIGNRSFLGTSTMTDMAIDPNTPMTIYAGTSKNGVFKSYDGGVNWGKSNLGLPNKEAISDLYVDPRDSTIYAATYENGIYKSGNGGGSWVALNQALDQLYIHSLTVDPTNPSTIYLGAADGVYKSTDQGSSWDKYNEGLASCDALSLAADFNNPNTIFAGFDTLGIQKSVDGGRTWDPVTSGFHDLNVRSMVINPKDADIIHVVFRVEGHYKGVYKSTDKGNTWASANNGLESSTVLTLLVNPSSPDTIYAGTLENGIFITTDGGLTWNQKNAGFPDNNNIIRAIALNPISNMLFAWTFQNGLFTSNDGGDSWKLIHHSDELSEPETMSIDPNNPRILYTATSMGELFKSINGGIDWEPIQWITHRQVFVMSVIVDSGSTIFAGASDGIYMSRDEGDSWINIGPNAGGVTLLVIPSTPEILIAGTYNGVYTLQLSE